MSCPARSAICSNSPCPEEDEIKSGKWTFEKLPHLPPGVRAGADREEASRLAMLMKLIKRKDVSALINACDAGREGELIFRYIVRATEREAADQAPLAADHDAGGDPRRLSAICAATRRCGRWPMPPSRRCEADWLVGINGTRAMTAFNSKRGGFQKTTGGRVQTPTLAILVEREEKIRAFVPRDYLEVVGDFGVPAGSTRPLVRREVQRKKADDEQANAERLWDEAQARSDRRRSARQAGHHRGGNEADDAGAAAALRPHDPAARSQRPLRLSRAHDAVDRAGALREAQGADLSADRLALAAGGSRRHGEARDERALHDRALSRCTRARR